ncbi:chitin synthase-domain-containing protein [Mycena rebaudengoi]|nr:chitin synthase-domain-containing protein [Mycena rebaudengoi]
MSRYPEADEAQHRGYNDGYNPYNSQYDAHPNDPFSTPQSQHPPYDPHAAHYTATSPPPGTHFADAPQHQGGYDPYFGGAHSPPPMGHPAYPPADPYGPNHPIHSPPPQGTHDYLATPFQPPPPSATPLAYNAYSLTDDGPTPHEEINEDHGDMPLLRRDPSSHSGFNMPLPGDYIPEEDGSINNNIRYGRIPQRVPRRYKTIKRVELFHGNFVLDSPVPKKLLDMCANRTEREYSYSAATCDPNDFKNAGFTLRQVHYDPPRRTELFIVMIMYNEDEELFCRSMHGVVKNIAHLCKRDRWKTWGKDGWKRWVVVCVVSDGRSKINSRTLSVLATMGCYQEGIAKDRCTVIDATTQSFWNKVNDTPVTAHIYEYTTQISVTPTSYWCFK